MACRIRVTFAALSSSFEPGRDGFAPGARTTAESADRFERDTVAIVQRLSRRPVAVAPESELMADLGFDSLLVLELVGELEDHFKIAVPLNTLTHIRTVAQIAAEARRISAESQPPQP